MLQETWLSTKLGAWKWSQQCVCKPYVDGDEYEEKPVTDVHQSIMQKVAAKMIKESHSPRSSIKG
jgi:hypothetical protein